jgi:glycosyltransferase involved in cell wall biosynthesis
MRVLYLNPSAELGGAERALLEVIRALRQLEPSWKLGLIALENGPALSEARSLGVDVHVLPMPEAFAATGESGRSRSATLLRLTRQAGPLVGYARTLGAKICAWSPDVVHSNGVKTHVLGAWSGSTAPLIWHVHDYLSERPVSARLLRHHRRSVAAIIANSRSVARDATDVLRCDAPVETVYNAIDVERFSPHGAKADLDAAAGLPPAPDGTLRVGLVATFARWKGHDVFIRALAGLSAIARVRGYVIGGPLYRTGSASQVTLDELRALVRELGLDNIGFAGFMPEPADAYRALDVVVHASTRPEPFGLCIAEAMACGRAVIISDAGGAREIGEPGPSCLAHTPGDVSALREQLARLIDDSSLRERLGASAASVVRQRFSHARLGHALRAIYQQVTAHVHHA